MSSRRDLAEIWPREWCRPPSLCPPYAFRVLRQLPRRALELSHRPSGFVCSVNYRVGRLNFRTVRPAGGAVNVFVSAATVVGMPAAGS